MSTIPALAPRPTATRGGGIRRFLAGVLAAWLLAAGNLAAEEPTARTTVAGYAGRKLENVLEQLRDAGLNLVYSTRLVRPEMRVPEEPKARTPRAVLDEVLAPHGLAARSGPGETIIVVKGPQVSTGPSSRRPDEGMRLGFSETVDVAGAGAGPATAGAAPLRLRGSDVLLVPGAIDNVFRALQAMPGITGAGLFGTRLAVRGGGPDQNLTVMDGVEIHNPFRLQGAVSGFNPETVGRFDLTAGAFPPRYGDRLSSLLVVDTRDGTREEAFAGSASLSVTDASAVFEGRLPGGKGGSWLLAGRRTYYDLVAERVLDDQLPSFDDVQLKLSWTTDRGHRLWITGLRSRENADAEFLDPVERLDIFGEAASDLLALGYEAPLGERASLRGVASAYRFRDTFDFEGTTLTDTRVSFSRASPQARGSSNDQFVTLGLLRGVRVEDLALRQEVAFDLSPRHRLEAGIEAHRLDTGFRLAVSDDRNDEVPNGSSILVGSGLPDSLGSTVDSTRLAFFLQDRLVLAGERLVLEPGLRVERTGISGETAVSPRLRASLELGGLGRLKAAAGLHSQSPGYEKLLHSDYFVDLSRDARRGLRNERSLHLVLGLERAFGRQVFASVEGYYRDFSRLVVGRLESEEERRARVARYDFPEELAWGVPTQPRITSHPTNGAEGRAYGLIAFLKKEDEPEARLAGWVSYAWGRAQRTAYGRQYPFDYDRPHSFAAAGVFRVSPSFEVGATARVASGRPTTPPRGVLVLGVADADDFDGDGDRDELLPGRDDAGRIVYVADPGGAATLNSDRLPTYGRVDVRLTFRPGGRDGRWLFYVEALNVLNRRNGYAYDWDIRLDPGAERPRIEVGEPEDGIPVIPTFGVRFRF